MSEESKTHLVPVRIFSGNTARLDAELARGLLAQEGIECEIPGEVAADTFPFLDVQLLVREEDAERAAQFLESALSAAGSEDQSAGEEEEPEAG
jgi:Putative prokaryotic signal transducing protein